MEGKTMKHPRQHWKTAFLLGLCLLLSQAARGATLHVWTNSPSPSSPYDSWTNAAHDIQTAVDASQAGDVVLVTNGIYATGGRAVYGLMTNRVALTVPITLASVNGPEATIIEGYRVPGITNGPEAVRCVYLTNGAAISGFTLTNGATLSSGAENSTNGGGAYCESSQASVSNCIIVNNVASEYGGGVYSGTIFNSTLSGNSCGEDGGGAYRADLFGCRVNGNAARVRGGGLTYGSGQGCVFLNNRATAGGGTHNARLANCWLANNSAEVQGGGAHMDSGLINIATLINCTLIWNTAKYRGGGAFGPRLTNCIVYYNQALLDPNYYASSLNKNSLHYCCTTPLPDGVGNITNEPLFVGDYHLADNSPCVGAGTAAHVKGTDLDGEAWATSPSMGCDELHAEGLSGPIAVKAQANWTNVAVGFAVDFGGEFQGKISESTWSFADGTTLSGQLNNSHAWSQPGIYPVALTAKNQDFPDGISSTVLVHVVERPNLYVALDSPAPAPPFDSWLNAAQTIQAAVDFAQVPGSMIWVSNGVYATGGTALADGLTNRLCLGKPLTVCSVNGPAVTVIKGYQPSGQTNAALGVRCAYLTNGAMLSGFTLTNGATLVSGASSA